LAFTVAFDVDGTLISEVDDSPNWPVVDLLRQFHALGATIIVWSGGGADYAEMWVRRLNLDGFVSGTFSKTMFGVQALEPSLAVDDEDVSLGVANFKVVRP
jgi:phosphoserine phosphatase